MNATDCTEQVFLEHNEILIWQSICLWVLCMNTDKNKPYFQCFVFSSCRSYIPWLKTCYDFDLRLEVGYTLRALRRISIAEIRKLAVCFHGCTQQRI